MERMEVLLDDNEKVFRPGDLVKGKLILKSAEDQLAITDGRLCCKGQSVVGWSGMGDKTMVQTGGEEYFKFEKKFCDKSNSTSNFDDWTLNSKRLYQIFFEFLLPNYIPSSYESENAWIRYSISGYMKTHSKRNLQLRHLKHVRLNFQVKGFVTLDNFPECKNVISLTKTRKARLALITLGRISARIALSKTGYLAGETIPVDGECINNSSLCYRCSLQMQQILTLRSRSGSQLIQINTISNHLSGKLNNGSTYSCSTAIKIPEDIKPSQQSSILDIEYVVQLHMHTVAAIGRILTTSINIKIPIVIGTDLRRIREPSGDEERSIQ